MTVRVYACILGSTFVITTLKMIEGSALVVTLDEALLLRVSTLRLDNLKEGNGEINKLRLGQIIGAESLGSSPH